MVELRTQEQRLLATLEQLGGKGSVEQLIDICELPETAVMRTALTLQETNLVAIHAQYQNALKLTVEGEKYAKNGLPERNLTLTIAQLGGAADLQKAALQAGIEHQFIQIALGWAIRKKWALYTSSDNTIRISEPLLHQAYIQEGCDETLLKYLNDKHQHQATLEELSPELKEAAEQLKKRKLVTIEPKTTRTIQITAEGKEIIKKIGCANLSENLTIKAPEIITQLTPELIITGKWHTSKLQKYNIEAPVAKTWPGKKHPYLQFLDEVRAKLVQLGFQEMTGTAVETSFFNFDALYVPQDHPAREKATFTTQKIPRAETSSTHSIALEHVAETHENGWKTGSTGWGYKYSF